MLRFTVFVLFFCSALTLHAQIHITEVMYTPNAPEPEWVELHNGGPTAVTVTGWSVHDGSTTVGTLPAATIAGGGFLVVTRDSTALRAARAGTLDGVVLVESGLPSFNNSSDLVVLRNPSGVAVDSLNYSAGWGGTGGVSLERARVDRPNDSANWGSSVAPAGATPGRTNSITPPALDLAIESVAFDPGTGRLAVALHNRGVAPTSVGTLALFFDANGNNRAEPGEQATTGTTPALGSEGRDTARPVWPRPLTDIGEGVIVVVTVTGDERTDNDTARLVVRALPLDTGVVLNEIMFDPLPFDEESGAEYVELYNLNDRPVRIDGWTVLDATARVQGTVPAGAPLLGPHGYVALASDSSIYARFPALRDSGNVVLLDRTSLGLNGDEDDVVIRSVRGATVDSVRYRSGWHRTTLGETRGFSLERISAGSGTNDRRNWSTSADPLGGTPAARNSLEIPPTTTSAELVASPETVSPDGDGFEDFIRASWRLPTRTARITAFVYDRNGRVVRRLANNEPAAAEGEVIWDGRDDEGRTPGIGPYIIRVEAYDDAGGGVSAAQAVVVVAKRL